MDRINSERWCDNQPLFTAEEQIIQVIWDEWVLEASSDIFVVQTDFYANASFISNHYCCTSHKLMAASTTDKDYVMRVIVDILRYTCSTSNSILWTTILLALSFDGYKR